MNNGKNKANELLKFYIIIVTIHILLNIHLIDFWNSMFIYSIKFNEIYIILFNNDNYYMIIRFLIIIILKKQNLCLFL